MESPIRKRNDVGVAWATFGNGGEILDIYQDKKTPATQRMCL
jgi:hypothetical protein